jgi:hypothetical protein
MDGGVIALIVIVVIIVVFMFSPLAGRGQGLYAGGSKKGEVGVVGLLVVLFGILGLSNYLQTIM